MKTYVCFILLILFSFKEDTECIDLSHTKFISVNCELTDCFRIISKCKFLKYKITVSNREAKELLQFESKSSDIEEINTYMNNLRNDSLIMADTYYAKLLAYRYTDTTVRTFIFGLFKNSKPK